MILASKSPRRKEILEDFGFEIEIIAEDVVEESSQTDSLLWAQDIALKKGRVVAEKNKERWVISADTVVVFNDEFLGKPKDKDEAKKILEKLSGNTHEVVTAVAMMNLSQNIEFAFADVTEVKFKKLDSKEIEWYVESGEPMDKAGSYGIQGKGSIFIEKIEGDFFNVMGFPISKFYDKLKELDYSIEDLYKI